MGAFKRWIDESKFVFYECFAKCVRDIKVRIHRCFLSAHLTKQSQQSVLKIVYSKCKLNKLTHAQILVV